MNSGYFTVVLILGSIAAGPLLAQQTGPQDPTKMPRAEVAKVQQALRQQGYDPVQSLGPGETHPWRL
jgi:hypothetical protein